MNQRRNVIVLGRGFVGGAVADALRMLPSVGEVTSLEPAEVPELGDRTPAGADLLAEHLTGSLPTTVINCCGRLRGTDGELDDANHRWPAWLTEVLAGRPVRLVHLGSASEYGDPGGPHPLSETSPARPSGAYGETKWAGSSAVLDARAGGLDAVVVRGFNLVAANLSEVSPLYQFRSDVEALPPEGGTVTLWYPETVRDFILLDDLARVVARTAVLDAVPDLLNACSGIGVSFGSIVEALGDATGRRIEIESLDRPGIPVVIGDPARMHAICGVHPVMDAALLARTILGID